MAAVGPPGLRPGRCAVEDQVPELGVGEDGGVELLALGGRVDGLRRGRGGAGEARERRELGVPLVLADVVEEVPAGLEVSLLAVLLGADVQRLGVEVAVAGLRFGLGVGGGCRGEGLLVEGVLAGCDADLFALWVWLACPGWAQQAGEHGKSEQVKGHGVVKLM